MLRHLVMVMNFFLYFCFWICWFFILFLSFSFLVFNFLLNSLYEFNFYFSFFFFFLDIFFINFFPLIFPKNIVLIPQFTIYHNKKTKIYYIKRCDFKFYISIYVNKLSFLILYLSILIIIQYDLKRNYDNLINDYLY